ncbi:MAG TPA: hypothetical protein VGE72_28995 [Azospirillum sp.]
MLLLAPGARAQAPGGSYCYIFGRSADDDFAGQAKAPLPDGERDTELRLYLNNLYYYLGPSGSHHIRSMRLRHRTLPGLRWDTVPGSRAMGLVVRWNGRTVNRGDGSIDGLNLPDRAFLQLFVADPGPVAARTQGFVLDVTTMDGTLTIPVVPFDRNDNQFY